ncbi:MAG: hypothetical protein RR317_05055 [Bilophila sp.]
MLALWAQGFRGLFLGLPLLLALIVVTPATAEELYEQPPFTPTELNKLIDDLPRFRTWVKVNKEKAHPILTAGKPDFLYSPQAAQEVQRLGWEPRRFFCVMGRAAAALAIIEQGTELTNEPPADMPRVRPAEMDAVRRNLTSLLQAVARPVDGASAPHPHKKPTFADKASGNVHDKAKTSGTPSGK